ncbi:MAG: chlorite dismutase family protein [Planctomycetaceae bacterium]|nr:chlorite dismutase family protein [Planctomycetaceae bacterium]
MSNRFYSFIGGNSGRWRVCDIRPIVGQGLDSVSHIEVTNEELRQLPTNAAWCLRGVTSNQRYTQREELNSLVAVQPVLGRKEATCAALIPITKSVAWWELPQDERREIIESRSAHIATGLRYLPAVARRLHHSRDLGEPFDFITWFEFAPQDTAVFDELVAALRKTEEWNYVEREIDIRLTRSDTEPS